MLQGAAFFDLIENPRAEKEHRQQEQQHHPLLVPVYRVHTLGGSLGREALNQHPGGVGDGNDVAHRRAVFSVQVNPGLAVGFEGLLQPLRVSGMVFNLLQIVIDWLPRLHGLAQNFRVGGNHHGVGRKAAVLGCQKGRHGGGLHKAHHHTADLSGKIHRRVEAHEPLGIKHGFLHHGVAGKAPHTVLEIVPLGYVGHLPVAGVAVALVVYITDPIKARVFFQLPQLLLIHLGGIQTLAVKIGHGGDGIPLGLEHIAHMLGRAFGKLHGIVVDLLHLPVVVDPPGKQQDSEDGHNQHSPAENHGVHDLFFLVLHSGIPPLLFSFYYTCFRPFCKRQREKGGKPGQILSLFLLGLE